MIDQQPDLFPDMMKRPFALVWVAAIPSLVLALVNAFSFWLVWGEMKEPERHVQAVVLVVLPLLPAATALIAFAVLKAKAMAVPPRLHYALGALSLAHLVCFVTRIDKVLPSDTPEWVVGPSFFLAQFACMMPGLFTGVWRIACMRMRFKPLADFGLSLAVTFLPPALLYLAVAVGSRLVSWPKGESLKVFFFVALMVAGPVFFFLGLLRVLMLARRYFLEQASRRRAMNMGYIGCVSLVLPIAGLLLNKQIPFPADFQNPWPYALTVANAVFLMMPATGVRGLDACARWMRVTLFPFTFYFFLVFLPFLPFSIIAVLAMGTGFLVLAPTLLFMVHGQILMRDHASALEAGAGRAALWARTVLCLLALPLGFAVRAEVDRYALRETLAFRYQPDYREDAKLSIPPALVRRVLLSVRRFKDGAELPYLTNWTNWRVFDNLLLQDEKAEELWRLIVGGEPPKPVKEDFFRNGFASLFGGKTRGPERRRWGGARRPMPNNVALNEVQTSYVTTNGETETRAVLKITSNDSAPQAEYAVKLRVPQGVWVSGLRLKINGRWEEGRVIERKAAEWVYRQIRDVSRRDPAILRYEDDETLSLRVFPVAPRETREVELAFLCPEGFADAVKIGERRVALGDGTVRPSCVWAGGVLARNASWRWPADSLARDGSPRRYLVLDGSEAMRWDRASLTRVSDELKTLWGAEAVPRVIRAHYEMRPERTLPLRDLPDALLREGLPEPRGSLDADGVLRRLARRSRLDRVCAPEIVFAGASALASLKRVKAETWQGFRNELPGVREVRVVGVDGTVTSFPVPGAVTSDGRVTLLTMGGDPRQDTGARSALIAFAGEVGPPAYRVGQTEETRAVSGAVERPGDSRWAKGAAAWRLQREWDENPARDGLRRDILAACRESGVLTSAGSYIVVENSTQWKMLDVKQRQALAGEASLDLVESPAPGAGVLVALGFLALWAHARFRSARRRA